DFAVVTETGNALPGCGIERDESPSRIDEHTAFAPVGPRGHPAMHKAGSIARLSKCFPGFRIKGPEISTCSSIERNHAIERRAEKKRIVNGQWRCLKLTRTCR